MADDVEKLKKHIKAAFQLRAFSLKRDALEYAVRILAEFDGEKRANWIERILAAIAKQNVSSPLIDLETLQSAIALCTNKKANKSESLFNVIDVFDAPRFEYNESRNKLVPLKGTARVVSSNGAMVALMKNRLKLVRQRALRSIAMENYKLTSVETLLGSARSVDNVIVLGMLSQTSSDQFHLDDLTGSMLVDLSKAEFHSGLFTDGCIMLMEGNYRSGRLSVTGVGLPPVETANATRAFFGNDNWFGGDSAVAYRTVPRLQNANARDNNARIVFVSDVWLDDERVMKGIYNLLVGFAESPPVAFVFCGNFCSSPGTPETYRVLVDGFRHLSNIVAERISVHPQLAESQFVFVPGPDDPSVTTVLPRPPLPFSLFEELQKVPNCCFASNPCRIQYANQEIVVAREDIVEKMCRNSIHMPGATVDIAEQLCRTLASAGHLCPLPLHVAPVLWEFDNALSLYPLPDVVVIADQFQQFAVTMHDCLFANPGSFARSRLDFHVYYPSTCEIEPSSIS